MSFDAIDRLQSENFDLIADAIENDPEWFQDDSIDDDDILEALRIAADALRRIGK